MFSQFHGFMCVLFSSHLHRYKSKRTLTKEEPDPSFELRYKVKGKGRMRKALQSTPLRRTESHQETRQKKCIMPKFRGTGSSD